MRKVFTFVGVSFLISQAVFAVGGGGGGSVPSCSADQWDCTGWSQCSSKGIQTRICNLTYDCPTANTPKPSESQSCTPPCSVDEWNCTEWSQCNAVGTQTRMCTLIYDCPTSSTPQPPEKQSCSPSPLPSPPQTPLQTEQQKAKTPSCNKDTWTCSNWSSSCDIYGREQRSCKLSFDCPDAQTPPPPETQPCQKIQCGNKPTLGERISCRLNLAPPGAARELELQYLPEACRVKTGDSQKDCIKLYKSFQPCWSVKEGEERFSCARSILKLGPVISDEVRTCQGKFGADQVSCKAALKEKVLYMIAFRFYDLETRAEELGNRGADLKAIADFETVVELKKQAFDKAQTNAERRQIILDVRNAWQEFINKVKDQVK